MENKVFVIGIDGMDPKMTRRMVDEGKLPNIEKIDQNGVCSSRFGNLRC